MAPVADAHVHFWNLGQHSYPWLEEAEPSGPFGKTAAIRRNYLLADYLADAAHQNVQRMVHVEAGWNPQEPLGEMRWIQALADRRGAPHAHIAHIDLAHAHVEAMIAAHATFPLFRGVRDRLFDGDFTAASVHATRMDNPAWRAGLKALDRRRLVFDLQCPPMLAPRAAKLVREFEGVSFVLTHAAYPPASESPDFQKWADGMAALSEAPNVAVKLSGLMLARKQWLPDDARHACDTLLQTFGNNRVLVASNFPVDRLFAPLDELFDSYREWISALPARAQHAILHDNTCRIYRLEH